MNTPLVASLITGIVVILLAISWLLVRALAKGFRVSLPAKLFWTIVLFDVLWAITFYVYASELDRMQKGKGITDDLFVVMATIQMWIYYITIVLLAAIAVWYFIHLATRAKRKR